MTKTTKLFAALAIAFASQSAMAAAVDFGGYIRSGTGTSSNDGKEACFRVKGESVFSQKGYLEPTAGAGRLGNECDTYGEFKFGVNIGESDGTKFRINSLFALGAQQSTDYEMGTAAFREGYVSAEGIGKGSLSKSTLWAGKRYYNRKDVHVVDQFWLEVAGPGAGLENIDVGFGKFSYAMMRAGNVDFKDFSDGQQIVRGTKIGDPTQQKVNHDFRLEQINLGKAGSIGVGLNLIQGNNHKGDNPGGWSGWVSHSMPLGTGMNNVIFEVARKAGSINGAGLWWMNSQADADGHKAWRLIDSYHFEIGDKINGAAFFGYGNEEFPWYGNAGDRGRTTKTFVVRPVYHFTENFSLAVEAGVVSVSGRNLNWDNNMSETTNHLTKFTVAPQYSLGSGFYSRPVLRAYYTHASWNKGGGQACTGRDCLVNVPSFDNATSGSSLGVQMEAWW